MSVIGYKRVSSEGQNLDRQDLGEVDKVFEEKLSGKSAKDRPALQAMIEYAREGDAVVVYSIDRLARDLTRPTGHHQYPERQRGIYQLPI